MLILPQLLDGPWSNRPRVAVLEITGQIGVQVRAQEMRKAPGARLALVNGTGGTLSSCGTLILGVD